MGKLYLTIAFILAGSSVVAAYFIAGYLPPFSTTFFSLTIASLTAIIFYGKKMVVSAKRLSKKTWGVIALQALLGSFLFRVFLTLGLQHIGAAEAGVITGTTPAFTALFTWILLRERLAFRSIIGILITVAGILLVQGFPFETNLENWQPLGALLVLGAAACEALFTTMSRKLHKGLRESEAISSAVNTGYVSIIATLLCLIPALIERPWAAAADMPYTGWLALVWYGSIVTIVAFSCMFAGAKLASGYTIAAFSGIIPVSSMALSVFVLGEAIGVYQIAGCALVVVATLVISKGGKIKNGAISNDGQAQGPA